MEIGFVHIDNFDNISWARKVEYFQRVFNAGRSRQTGNRECYFCEGHIKKGDVCTRTPNGRFLHIGCFRLAETVDSLDEFYDNYAIYGVERFNK